MNMAVTQRDKKLLGLLAAFFVFAVFFILVFSPLAEKDSKLEKELAKMQEENEEYGSKASGAQEMAVKEQSVQGTLSGVLARYYPMLESQDAERMITTLMINHGLEVQEMSVSMPDSADRIKWYQYSEKAKEQAAASADTESQETELLLYAARVTCVAEGEKQDLWALVDEVSASYPAISIVSADWSLTNQEEELSTAANTVQEEEMKEEGAGENVLSDTVRELPGSKEDAGQKTTDRLTISFEIFMCEQ